MAKSRPGDQAVQKGGCKETSASCLICLGERELMALKTKGIAAINETFVPLLFPLERSKSGTSTEGHFSLQNL